jgi:polygalacturonase
MPLTKASFSMVAGAPFNVFDYGATGNGVVSDEQPFIQAAIDAAFSAGGGTVRIPAGTYNIQTQIVLKAGVSFVGDGSDNTIIDQGSTSLTAIATPAVTPTALAQTNRFIAR